MRKHSILLLAFIATMPAWSQVQPSATGDAAPVEDEYRMVPPPLASTMLYPNVVGSEERSNFVSASITANGAYTDNILPSSGSTPISDYTVSILPTFSLDRKSPRQEETFTYSPSFTYYRNTSALNAFDQSATGSFEERLTPHSTLSLRDTFMKTSNVFNTPYPFAAGGLTGSSQTPVPAIIAPFAEQLRNDANVDMTYQFSTKGMIGAGGQFSNYRYPNQAQSQGLYNSDGWSGSAFYNRRLSLSQYAGVMYEYHDIQSYLNSSGIDSKIQAVLPFYSLSPTKAFSASVAVGAQRLSVLHQPQPEVTSWWPVAVASLGWQGNRSYVSASYLHTVVAGEGLQGPFTSDNTNVFGGWKIARSWTAAASFSYQLTNAASSITGLTYQDGTGITGTASLMHSFGEHFSIEAGYNRLHQDYKGLSVISSNPDSDRTFASITYNLRKSLGR